MDTEHAETAMAREDKMLEELRILNREIAQQNSLWRRFLTGIIYGIGFVIGSALLAALVVGLAAPILGNIPGVQALFTSGKTLLQR